LAEHNTSRVQELQRALDELRKDLRLCSLDEKIEKCIRRVISIHEGALDVYKKERVLQALFFDGIQQRYDMVDEAHAQTFRWLIDGSDDDYGSEDHGNDFDEELFSMKFNARGKFTSWLLSENGGAFHISGKLGSGKSTLMKLLVDSPRTRDALQSWAGGRTLVFTSFFFWKSGSQLQKSLAGLVRSILYYILRACPELVPDLLPDVWSQLSGIPWYCLSEISITTNDIHRGLTQVLQSPDKHSPGTRCFCFFIDGLDEYEETPQNDRKVLVDLLNNWHLAAPGMVKLCVSSREDNVFMNAFSHEHRLRLHELTRHDIKHYVTDRLQGIPDSQGKLYLVNNVLKRSHGIFLWVSLVVKLIREQMENGTNIPDLVKWMDGLPDELNSLFDSILQSLNPIDRKRAYQVFAMLREEKRFLKDQETRGPEHCGRMSFRLILLVALPYLDDYERSGSFALQDRLNRHLEPPVEVLRSRLFYSERRLRGWCRGLVEASSTSRGDAYVDFTHRSFADFLELPNIRQAMRSELEGFSAINALSRTMLAAAQ
ncbi:hypothetical protein B0T21DRAFT_270516, partial [Apiosordaria backusii]